VLTGYVIWVIPDFDPGNLRRLVASSRSRRQGFPGSYRYGNGG